MNFEGAGVPQHVMLKNDLRLTLRRAEPDDAEHLLIFLNQVAGESENITFGPGEFELTVEQERVFLQQVAASATSIYLIAEIASEIAGTLSFSTGKRPRLQHVWRVWYDRLAQILESRYREPHAGVFHRLGQANWHDSQDQLARARG